MSAPLIFIFFPVLISGVLFALRRYQRLVAASGVLIALLLATLAWRMPIGTPISFGPFSIVPILQINDSLDILGRQFIVNNSFRPILTVIYLAVAFWFGGATTAGVDRLFIPLGLAMASLLIAALAVEPFLYAALLIAIAVLVSVPIISPPGKPVGRGVTRYITLQILGVPLILFTGWMLSGVEANPGDEAIILRATMLIGLGFSIFSAVFPFHTWIPMLSEESHPYAASFIFFTLPTVVSLFGLGFLDRYAWIRTIPEVYQALRVVGALMVITGGVWAFFQHHLGRMLGYAATMEIGMALLALSLGFDAPAGGQGQAGGADIARLGIFFVQILPRGLAMALWAEALSDIQDMQFHAVRGLARRKPIAALSLVLSQLTLAGFPLLGGFPARVALWSALAQQSLSIAAAALIGSSGLLLAGLRTIAILLANTNPGSQAMPDVPVSIDEKWRSSENRNQRFLLITGCLMLVAVGLFPQWFFPPLASIARMFGARLP